MVCSGLRNPCGKPTAVPSQFCEVCTNLYLRVKYNFPRFRLPRDCDQFQLLGDLRICRDYKLRAKLQSRLHVRFPPVPEASTTASAPLVASGLPTLLCDRKGDLTVSPCDQDLEVDVPISSPEVSATLSTNVVTLPYDPSRCEHDCPLCERNFEGKDSRKELAKHVKTKHSPNPDSLRFKVWLEASHRSWCLNCSFSYSQRIAHVCKGPEVDALPLANSSSPVVTPTQVELEAKGEVACILPGWMEIFATSIPTVERIRSSVEWL